MVEKVRIAVFVSGGGTNLEALLKAQEAGKIPHGEIVLVCASNADAYALTRAAAHGVDGVAVPRKQMTQEMFEDALNKHLMDHHIDFIILAGFLSILSDNFVKQWTDRIINIHPSLIPAFCGKGMYGLKVHEAALEKGVKITGATVHIVNEVPDGGKILLQKAVEVYEDDTAEILQRRVMEQAEWILLPKAAEMIAEKIVKERINEEKTDIEKINIEKIDIEKAEEKENQMNLLVVGGGGREHAIIKKLKENAKIGDIYALPGNGGIANDAVCVPEIGAKDIDKIVAFAKANKIDFAVVAPDDPLALGCVDKLHEAGIPCFGPDAKAARIESSKVFAKNLMKKYNIPTAAYEVFNDPNLALAYLQEADFPIVIKADGLALGKGVLIVSNFTEAKDAVKTIMEDKAFGDSGNAIVIEEFLTGPEVSVLAFTDGKTIVPMISSMDHKRAGDGDTGLNTGGMGTIAPNPYYTDALAQTCMKTIFRPTLEAMRLEGAPFKGCLYFGLMMTPKGPKVIEYNCRFGDPETQVVLPLLNTDLLTIMQACENETLDQVHVEWKEAHAACVILASGGYPSSYEKGKLIKIPDVFPENVIVYHAGDVSKDGKLFTNGGRVLGVTATAPTLEAALKDAYNAAGNIHFDGRYMRTDIGKRALDQ